MALLQDRDDREWVELTQLMNELEQTPAWQEIATYLTAMDDRDCGEALDRCNTYSLTDAHLRDTIGFRRGLRAAVMAPLNISKYARSKLDKSKRVKHGS